MASVFDLGTLKACGDDVVIHNDVEITKPQLFAVGSHIAIDKGFYCTAETDMGDYIHIGPYVTVTGGSAGKLVMEHFTTVAAGSRIICVSEQYMGDGLVGPIIPEKYHDKVLSDPVVLERFSSVATNAVVLPGTVLAEGSVISACSLVAQSTKPWTVYAGVPARPIAVRRKDSMITMALELGYATAGESL